MSVITLIGPVLGGTGVVRAEDSQANYDARLRGYKNPSLVVLDAGTGWYYILMMVLGIFGASVMFKDAKRSSAK